MQDTVFREARWRRAGATDAQISDLADRHAALSVDERAAEGVRVDSVSDEDLAAELTVGDLTDGSVDEVLARIGDDAEKAAVALSQEQARSRPRKTVIDALNVVIEAAGSGD